MLDSVNVGRREITADSLEWVPYLAANSEEETYVRYLQITGAVPRYPWSLRGFSPREARRHAVNVGTHPWSRRGSLTSHALRARLLPVSTEVRANSSFPYGSNDGAVWAGRGLTASATIGLSFETGPISVVLAPTAFVTQNASFDLLDNGLSGRLRFADGLFPTNVDRPQRFGDKAYGRVDPGNSTVRADAGPFAAGISTANIAWGPMELYPFVVGTNAPGFLHGFVGTSRPVNLWVGSLHGRMIWGRLEQSAYSSVDGDPTYTSPSEAGRRRFGSGLVAVFEPRGLRGLELGLARFFHSPWPRSGIPPSYFTKPLESLLKGRLRGTPGFSDPGSSADNQLISGFVRWAFPTAGFEMYAEYGREDHTWDKRDFLQEPDHSRAYGIGLRKTVRLRPDLMEGLTVELINFQLPHLARTGRGEGGIYVHGTMRQGHTSRGQLLGADVGVGAASGSTIRWDRYRAQGHTAFSLNRVVRQERGDFYADGSADPKSSDVQYALEASRMRRLRKLEVTAGMAVVYGLNRNFRKDATNVSAVLRARVPLKR
jgi:hypothetical protein